MLLAAIMGVVEMVGGAQLLLHDTAGPCVGDAKQAEYVAADRKVIPGCWVVRGPVVTLVFFDGDIGQIPISQVKPPKSV